LIKSCGIVYDYHSSRREIHYISWDANVHYRFVPYPYSDETYPLSITPFNIILPSMPTSTNWHLPFGLRTAFMFRKFVTHFQDIYTKTFCVSNVEIFIAKFIIAGYG